MRKSLTSKLAAAAVFSVLSMAMLLAPLQASAGGTKSLGHGVKCGWVLVSYDPVTASSVYNYVCSQGV